MVWLWVRLISFKFRTHLLLSHGCARSPFHASLGIATSRMLIHLRKFASENLEVETDSRFLPNFEMGSSELPP